MRIARLLPALLVLTTGCARVKTSLQQPLDGPPRDKGVVVFSTGANEGSYVSVIALRMMSVARDGSTSDHETDVFINRGYDTSDFPGEHGHVRMMVLDEGAYCLYPRHTNPYIRFTGTIPHYAFRVRKGTLTYIGSIQMNGLSFTLRNEEKRDLPRVLAAQPALATLPASVTAAARLARCSYRF